MYIYLDESGDLGFGPKASDYLEIHHIDSTQDKCIQSVDFIVGAIARNYEHNDSLLYEIIDKKIEIALDFFKGQIK